MRDDPRHLVGRNREIENVEILRKEGDTPILEILTRCEQMFQDVNYRLNTLSQELRHEDCVTGKEPDDPADNSLHRRLTRLYDLSQSLQYNMQSVELKLGVNRLKSKTLS